MTRKSQTRMMKAKVAAPQEPLKDRPGIGSPVRDPGGRALGRSQAIGTIKGGGLTRNRGLWMIVPSGAYSVEECVDAVGILRRPARVSGVANQFVKTVTSIGCQFARNVMKKEVTGPKLCYGLGSASSVKPRKTDEIDPRGWMAGLGLRCGPKPADHSSAYSS